MPDLVIGRRLRSVLSMTCTIVGQFNPRPVSSYPACIHRGRKHVGATEWLWGEALFDTCLCEGKCIDFEPGLTFDMHPVGFETANRTDNRLY
jgi:hypothetical protein